ncbi:MAG: glycoside hydrolase, partial [Ignavibacteria bacterium]|nr:glycoside hydrolase [Ignavibacteria bacterium]
MNYLSYLCLLTLLVVPFSYSQHDIRTPEYPDDPYVPVETDNRERTPAYRVSTPGYFFTQVNIDSNGMNIVGDAANEPSIAVDPNDNTRIAIGWRQFDTITNNFRQAGNGYTTDGGLSWNYNDVIERGIFRSDPVLDSDADGNFYYNSLTTQGPDFVCDVFKSTDGGATWDDKTFAWGGDKQWMAIDKTGGIGNGNIYSNWTSFFSSCPPGNFTRSPDNGVTYDNCVEVPSIPYWGTLSVGANGNLFFGGFDLSTDDFQVVRSTTAQDPGNTPVTWDDDVQVDLGGQVAGNQGNSSPNPGGILGQVWVATDHSSGPTAGNVYLLCAAEPDTGPDPLDVMFSRSTDDGLTWSAPIRVYEDPDNEWQWMGTFSVAPNGRIDVIWLDTRDNPGTVLSSLYYSNSIDGGVSWSPPERISDEFDPHVGWPNQNKMGDYFDMVSDDEGAHLAWAATFNGEQDVYYARILAEAFIPEAPLLSQPANGATLQPVSLALIWEPAIGATGYHAQLDADGSFTAPVAEDSTLTGRFMDVSGLSAGSTYYWRVRSSSSAGFGAWSDAWIFTTGDN